MTNFSLIEYCTMADGRLVSFSRCDVLEPALWFALGGLNFDSNASINEVTSRFLLLELLHSLSVHILIEIIN